MMICCDQLVSIINLRALLKFQIFISYSVGIITDYVNFHTFENENDVISQQKVGI